MADFKAKAEAIWAALDQMAEKNPETYKQFINDQLNGDGAQDMLAQLKLGDGLFGGGSGGKSGGLGGGGGGLFGPSSAQSGPGTGTGPGSGRYGGGGGGSSGGGGGKCKGNKGGEEPDPVQSYRASIPSKKRSFLTTSNGRMGTTTSTARTGSSSGSGSGTGTGANSKNNNGSGTSTSSVSSPAPNNSLLDDAFSHSTLHMNPFLAQIIADDEEDEDLLLTELKMPKEGGGDGHGHVQAQPQSQISHQNDEVKDKSSKDIKKPGKKKLLIEEL